jgi:hypothetical protein
MRIVISLKSVFGRPSKLGAVPAGDPPTPMFACQDTAFLIAAHPSGQSHT